MDAAVVPIPTMRAFSDDEALAWLRANGPVQQSNAALARAWGWNATKVARRLKAWSDARLIERARHGIIVARPPAPVPVPADAPPVPAVQAAPEAAPAPPAAATPVRGRSTLHPVVVLLAAPLLATAALALGGVGLVLNARFAASFGQSHDAAWLLASIGIAIDLIAMLLPVAACQLWRQRYFVSALGAWAVWLIAITMTLLATSGFAATQIGDAVSGRTKIVDEATALTQTLTRLRAERARIAETRAVETIDAELQSAQPTAGPVWRITSGCTDVTRPESARLCETVQRLRQARGEALRRDTLDRDARAAEQRLATLPAVSSGDPGAAMMTELVGWISAGSLRIVPRDIERARVLGLMILPSLAGLLLGFATLMRAERTRRAAV